MSFAEGCADTDYTPLVHQRQPILVMFYVYERFVMAALWNKAGHYIFALWCLSSFFFLSFSSPNHSGRRLDVYHTSAHGVAFV